MFSETIWLPPAERDVVTPCPLPQQHPTVSVTVDDDSSPSKGLVLSVARAALEALSGYRPITQLTRWLSPEALDGLAMARRHGDWRGTAITRVWADQVTPRAIEGVAHLRLDGRHIALPIRLECDAGRWSCTHLGVLLPGSHMRS